MSLGFYAREPTVFFERPHVAFAARDRASVDAFFQTALDHGGGAVDAPREKPEFGFYSGYLEDPDGHVIEVGVPLEPCCSGDAARVSP